MKSQRVALLLVLGAAACMAAALSLPLLHSRVVFGLPGWVPTALGLRLQQWLEETAWLPVGNYSVWRIVGQLWAHHDYVVASVIVLLAVVFPIVDIALCAFLALRSAAISLPSRGRLLRAADSAARWSMGNVFIASRLIVFASAPAFGLTLEVRAGLYWYVAGIALLIVVSELIRQVGQVAAPMAKTCCK